MGLTIHYQFTTPLNDLADVRALMDSLRQFAQDLPFKEVDELLEFKGPEADYQHGGPDDEHRWLKVQAGRHVEADGYYVSVKPTHIVGFSTWPGEGCEEANFGLALYPAHVLPPASSGRKGRLATHLDGWRWGSFCKTQYASAPESGGVQNFLRCHLCVVKLLDFARSTKLMEVEVKDEGGYWKDRNLEKLARNVGDWNEFIAALAGQLKDAAAREGGVAEAAITGFQNFEHLEAKGLARLERLRSRREGKDD